MFRPERWRHVDLVLSCGDMPPEYLDFLVTSLDVPLFYVRGNHDGAYAASRYAGCTNVHGRIVEYRGIRIAGFEGSMRYNLGPVQYTERQMERAFACMRVKALLRGKPDVIITHAPPAGPHAAADPAHAGFETFNRVMLTWHPRFLVHGHTHAYNGKQESYTVDGTEVVNAYPYAVFELETQGATAAEPQGARPRRLSRLLHLPTSHPQ
jgi:Icc-related predicted phosphoesterase